MTFLTSVAALPPTVVAVLALAALVLLSAWAFSPPKRRGPKPRTQKMPHSARKASSIETSRDSVGYGLLVPASRRSEESVADSDRTRLQLNGVRATIGREGEEYLVLVFHSDVPAAKHILASEAS